MLPMACALGPRTSSMLGRPENELAALRARETGRVGTGKRERTAHAKTRRRYKELKLVGNVLQVPFELMTSTTIGAPGGGKCLWTTLVVDIVALLRNVSATSFKFIRSVQVGEHNKRRQTSKQTNRLRFHGRVRAHGVCAPMRITTIRPSGADYHASHGTAASNLREVLSYRMHRSVRTSTSGPSSRRTKFTRPR